MTGADDVVARLAAKFANLTLDPVPLQLACLLGCTHSDPTSGCMHWMLATSHGYGQFRFRGRSVRVHRLVWCLANDVDLDDLAADTVIRHRCDTPSCIRPQCLQDGTQADNLRDAIERGRRRARRIDVRTHCKHGHEFTSANTRIRPRGDRECKTCHREANRLYRERLRDRRLVHALTTECPELCDFLIREVDAGRLDAADAGDLVLALADALLPKSDAASTKPPR
jgi:hypothetical protein